VASLEGPAVDPRPAVDAQPASAGVADLYRAVWAWLGGKTVRQRLAIVIEVGFIAAWFLLRTRYDVESRPYLVWTIATALIALVSPTSGLVILAGTAPFFEPTTLLRVLGISVQSAVLGMRHVLVAALGISVLIRLVAAGWRRMPWSWPVYLAIAIGALTAAGVVVTATRFPIEWTKVAATTWLSSVGGATIVLVVAVWVARHGSWRAVLAAVVSTTLAVGLSVIEQLDRGAISGSPLEWIGFWKDFGARLGGAVPSPNGMAALAVVPVCLVAAYAILTSGLRGRVLVARIAAAVVAAILFLAMYLTFSRAALLSMFGLAVIVAWRIHRRLGQVVLVLGVVAAIALLPSYLALRQQTTGVQTDPGTILVASDALRLQAWDSAAHMWLDQPVTGQGFLAYKQLADAYGDTVLSSPHNEWLRLFAEEGVVAGITGLAFIAALFWSLAKRHDPVGSGIFAGAIGYVLMASFNNPFLFIQVSAVVFVGIGYGLARSRHSGPAADSPGEEMSVGELEPARTAPSGQEP
jgi:hypothetical protein